MSNKGFGRTKLEPWWWEWAPPPSRKPGVLPERADIVIVGAGYTGLMAALTLSRAGRDVLVLEAQTIGYGASSRNGGQVGSGNQRCTVAQLISEHGDEKARALLREGTAALTFVKSFIEDEGIQCDFRVAGRFRGAIRPAHYEAMAREMEDWRTQAGIDSFMVPRAEQHSEIGTELYHGGCVIPGDASVHPARYLAGLVERAETAGASLLSHSPVIGLREDGERALVRTSRGDVSAGDVLVATNGYTTRATPKLYRRVVPVGSAMIATVELPSELMARLMPKRRVCGDTLRVHHYYQTSPDGLRILFGGRLAWRGDATGPRDFAHLYRDLISIFPELDGVEISHAWSGYVGYTRDTLPHIGRRGRIYHALGYCGSGVARASYAGRQAALQILGRPEGMSAWNDLHFGAMPLRGFAPLGVLVVTHWKRFLDRRA